MAKAYECDFCGRLFSRNDENEPTMQMSDVYVINNKSGGGFRKHWEQWDICQKCTRSLLDIRDVMQEATKTGKIIGQMLGELFKNDPENPDNKSQ